MRDMDVFEEFHGCSVLDKSFIDETRGQGELRSLVDL